MVKNTQRNKMMPHSHENIKKETGLKPYATWNLRGDYSREVLSLLNKNGVIINNLKPVGDTFIMIDVDKKEPYNTSISLATRDNKEIGKDAETAFRLISEYVKSNPNDHASTISYGHAWKLRNKIAKKKESLVDKL